MNRKGILDSSSSSNPFRNYTHAVVPYCSGDLYSGTGNAQAVHFSGHRIVSAALAFVLERMEQSASSTGPFALDELILAGGSAGGIGTLISLDWVAEASSAKKIRRKRMN